MTHMAWDFGMVVSAIKQVIKGARIPIKTVKTLCNKQVKENRIDNQNPTCPRCRQLYQQFRQDTAAVQATLTK
jgi:Zn finger protein HypA/HybF involved in hydrogenase expression